MSEKGVLRLVEEARNGSESSLAIATRVRIMGVDYVRADIAEEDARLMAAAPDLLAELMEAVEIITALRIALDAMRGLTFEESESLITDQTAGMCAVIAKAEGET